MSKQKKPKKKHPQKNQTLSHRQIVSQKGKEVLHNASRNEPSEAIMTRYGADETYRAKFCEMYDEYCRSERFKNIIDGLSEELCKYAGGAIPDYVGYKLHFYETYIKNMPDQYESYPGFAFANPDGVASAGNSEAEMRQTVCILLPLIFAHTEQKLINRDQNAKLTKEDRTNYNVFKLLYSVLSGNLAYIVDLLMNIVETEKVEFLDDDIDKLNTRALVQRFFEGVKKREKSVCFKLLGRARDLDPGESEYLEAVAHYYDQNYEDAIRYASRVKEEHADYGKAVALLLECYAAQGDAEKLLECIGANDKLSYQQSQLCFLLQETTMHLRQKPYDEWIGKLLKVLGKANKSAGEGNEYFNRIAKNMTECIYAVYTNIFNSSYYPNEAEEETDEKVDKNYLALLVVSNPCEDTGIKNLIAKIKTMPETMDDKWLNEFRMIACAVVCMASVDANPAATYRMVINAMEFQYRVGLTASFIGNINGSIESLVQCYKQTKDEAIAGALLSAYTEESIRGKIDPKLKAFVESDLVHEIDKNDMNRKRVQSKLSKEASIALESAETLFNLSKSIDWGWKDAGMISLAYYRIVEVELNQKILLPVAKQIGMEQIKDEYDAVRASLRGDDKKAYSSKWSRLLSSLKAVLKDPPDVDGLMLGEFEYFFKNIGSDLMADDALAQDIRKGIADLLTDGTDMDTFISFLETDVVNEGNREKYRNPPAHTRYLPYKTACECRDYFYTIMLQLTAALKGKEQ